MGGKGGVLGMGRRLSSGAVLRTLALPGVKSRIGVVGGTEFSIPPVTETTQSTYNTFFPILLHLFYIYRQDSLKMTSRLIY